MPQVPSFAVQVLREVDPAIKNLGCTCRNRFQIVGPYSVSLMCFLS